MSDKVQGWVWDLDVPQARKLVLLWLAGRATDNGQNRDLWRGIICRHRRTLVYGESSEAGDENQLIFPTRR